MASQWEPDPLVIPKILSRILSHLTLPQLMACREVSSFWKKIARPHFISLSSTTIAPFRPGLSQYLQNYPKYLHQNVKFNFENFPLCEGWRQAGNLNNSEILTSFESFKYKIATRFVDHGTAHVKNVSFVYSAQSRSNSYNEEKVLSFLPIVLTLFKNIEELNLSLKLTDCTCFSEKLFLSSKDYILNSLKVLKLNIQFQNVVAFQDTKCSTWAKEILEVGSNARKIIFCKSVLTEMSFEVLAKHKDLMPNLEDIQMSQTRSVIQSLLLKLERNLKRLDLGYCESTRILGEILQKLGDSLEELSVALDTCGDKAVAIPELKKLKVLRIYYCGSSPSQEPFGHKPKGFKGWASNVRGVLPENVLEHDMLKLFELFKDQSILEQRLPKLGTLSLNYFDLYRKSFYDSVFLSDKGQRFPQILILEVNYPQDVKSLEYYEWTRGLSHCFPNVRNAHLEYGRVSRPFEPTSIDNSLTSLHL